MAEAVVPVLFLYLAWFVCVAPSSFFFLRLIYFYIQQECAWHARANVLALTHSASY